MYYWAFNEWLGRYALMDENRLMNLNPPPGHTTEDMRRIANTLNSNAELVAALEGMERIVEHVIDPYGNSRDWPERTAARAALARAKGGV